MTRATLSHPPVEGDQRLSEGGGEAASATSCREGCSATPAEADALRLPAVEHQRRRKTPWERALQSVRPRRQASTATGAAPCARRSVQHSEAHSNSSSDEASPRGPAAPAVAHAVQAPAGGAGAGTASDGLKTVATTGHRPAAPSLQHLDAESRGTQFEGLVKNYIALTQEARDKEEAVTHITAQIEDLALAMFQKEAAFGQLRQDNRKLHMAVERASFKLSESKEKMTVLVDNSRLKNSLNGTSQSPLRAGISGIVSDAAELLQQLHAEQQRNVFSSSSMPRSRSDQHLAGRESNVSVGGPDADFHDSSTDDSCSNGTSSRVSSPLWREAQQSPLSEIRRERAQALIRIQNSEILRSSLVGRSSMNPPSLHDHRPSDVPQDSREFIVSCGSLPNDCHAIGAGPWILSMQILRARDLPRTEGSQEKFVSVAMAASRSSSACKAHAHLFKPRMGLSEAHAQHTRKVPYRNGSPAWNEHFTFTAAMPCQVCEVWRRQGQLRPAGDGSEMTPGWQKAHKPDTRELDGGRLTLAVGVYLHSNGDADDERQDMLGTVILPARPGAEGVDWYMLLSSSGCPVVNQEGRIAHLKLRIGYGRRGEVSSLVNWWPVAWETCVPIHSSLTVLTLVEPSSSACGVTIILDPQHKDSTGRPSGLRPETILRDLCSCLSIGRERIQFCGIVPDIDLTGGVLVSFNIVEGSGQQPSTRDLVLLFCKMATDTSCDDHECVLFQSCVRVVLHGPVSDQHHIRHQHGCRGLISQDVEEAVFPVTVNVLFQPSARPRPAAPETEMSKTSSNQGCRSREVSGTCANAIKTSVAALEVQLDLIENEINSAKNDLTVYKSLSPPRPQRQSHTTDAEAASVEEEENDKRRNLMLSAFSPPLDSRFAEPGPPQAGTSNNDLVRCDVAGVGLALMESNDDKIPKVYVYGILPGGAAHRDGNIQIGDVILAVGGQDVCGLPHAEVRKKVVGRNGTMISIRLQRCEEQSLRTYEVALVRGYFQSQNYPFADLDEMAGSRFADAAVAQRDLQQPYQDQVSIQGVALGADQRTSRSSRGSLSPRRLVPTVIQTSPVGMADGRSGSKRNSITQEHWSSTPPPAAETVTIRPCLGRETILHHAERKSHGSVIPIEPKIGTRSALHLPLDAMRDTGQSAQCDPSLEFTTAWQSADTSVGDADINYSINESVCPELPGPEDAHPSPIKEAGETPQPKKMDVIRGLHFIDSTNTSPPGPMLLPLEDCATTATWMMGQNKTHREMSAEAVDRGRDQPACTSIDLSKAIVGKLEARVSGAQEYSDYFEGGRRQTPTPEEEYLHYRDSTSDFCTEAQLYQYTADSASLQITQQNLNGPKDFLVRRNHGYDWSNFPQKQWRMDVSISCAKGLARTRGRGQSRPHLFCRLAVVPRARNGGLKALNVNIDKMQRAASTMIVVTENPVWNETFSFYDCSHSVLKDSSLHPTAGGYTTFGEPVELVIVIFDRYLNVHMHRR